MSAHHTVLSREWRKVAESAVYGRKIFVGDTLAFSNTLLLKAKTVLHICGKPGSNHHSMGILVLLQHCTAIALMLMHGFGRTGLFCEDAADK